MLTYIHYSSFDNGHAAAVFLVGVVRAGLLAMVAWWRLLKKPQNTFKLLLVFLYCAVRNKVTS